MASTVGTPAKTATTVAATSYSATARCDLDLQSLLAMVTALANDAVAASGQQDMSKVTITPSLVLTLGSVTGVQIIATWVDKA